MNLKVIRRGDYKSYTIRNGNIHTNLGDGGGTFDEGGGKLITLETHTEMQHILQSMPTRRRFKISMYFRGINHHWVNSAFPADCRTVSLKR